MLVLILNCSVSNSHFKHISAIDDELFINQLTLSICLFVFPLGKKNSEHRSPDTSKVRSKMVYASSKDRFKRELDGIQVELQATDPSEMSMDIIKGRAL